ncbi:MAG TPA: hypothetical protein VMH83_05890 [Candidatus Acidoferrum sp.]|nr:hypothetical protein [Candidatus Acidoferrum sp.]
MMNKRLLAGLAASLLLAPLAAMAANQYTEADFDWSDPLMKFHKATIVAGVNMLARENPACASIDLKSVQLDPNHGNPDDPAFTVVCSNGAKKTTVLFTKVEAVGDGVAPKH